jgi:hypothetical protein
MEKLEVWVGSLDVNFHYDLLKPFLEVWECIGFARCNLFFPTFRKKVMMPKAKT